MAFGIGERMNDVFRNVFEKTWSANDSNQTLPELRALPNDFVNAPAMKTHSLQLFLCMGKYRGFSRCTGLLSIKFSNSERLSVLNVTIVSAEQALRRSRYLERHR